MGNLKAALRELKRWKILGGSTINAIGAVLCAYHGEEEAFKTVTFKKDDWVWVISKTSDKEIAAEVGLHQIKNFYDVAGVVFHDGTSSSKQTLNDEPRFMRHATLQEMFKRGSIARHESGDTMIQGTVTADFSSADDDYIYFNIFGHTSAFDPKYCRLVKAAPKGD